MSDHASPAWRAARIGGVILTALLLWGLVAHPEVALQTLWNVVIPLVPASLLVSPLIWRNVCPLATLDLWSNGRLARTQQSRRFAAWSGALGMVLLVALVPARRFLFNTNGPALAATIVIVALLALALGAAFDMKAGFCNALCPILPVERLYGQSPLVQVANARCASCSLCSRACIDLAPEKAIAQHIGPSRRTISWLGSPFGMFAGAFPGFVFGYFTIEDVSLAAADAVYFHVLGWAALGYLLTLATVSLLRLPYDRALMALAALAAGLYYWFGAPGIAEGLGLAAGGNALRFAALTLVLVWWVRAERRAFRRRVRTEAGRWSSVTAPSKHA